MSTPDRIGRYEILSIIARGGMSIVYLAQDSRFNRKVAIKLLAHQQGETDSLRRRFRREAETIAGLEHPAIVPVYDFGEDGVDRYLVMRYMSGGSLGQKIQNGPLSPQEASQIIQRIGSALTEAHAKGVIHRDLKPDNILFDNAGRAYLSDFGIAKLLQATMTATGAILGTPAYMSPEQVQGTKETDHRSDIYALGAILFEMLTGERPFKGETPIKQATARILQPAPDILVRKSDLPMAWNTIIKKAMTRDINRRYQSISEFVKDVMAVADGHEPVSPPSIPPTIKSPAPDPTVLAVTRPTESVTTPEHQEQSVIPPISAGIEEKERKLPKWMLVAAGLIGVGLVIFLIISQFNGQPELNVTPTTMLIVAGDPTETQTSTPMPTPSPGPTETPTLSATNTATATPTETATPTLTPILTATETIELVPLMEIVFSAANVRRGPGTNYPIIATLNAGDMVIVLGRDGSGTWYNVEFADGSRGWINESVAKFIETSMADDILLAITIPAPPLPTNTPIPTTVPTSPPGNDGGSGDDSGDDSGGGSDNNQPPTPALPTPVIGG